MKTRLLLSLMMVLSVSCSQRIRSSDPQLSSEALQELLQEAEQGSGANVMSSSGVPLSEDPNTSVFFADGNYDGKESPMGTVRNILAFRDLAFLNRGESIGEVTNARVFFLDNPWSSPRCLLIVGIAVTGDSQYTYYHFEGDGSVEGGEFKAYLTGSAGDLVVTSFDTVGNSLLPTIQMRVYDPSNGYYGKFSVLAGYR